MSLFIACLFVWFLQDYAIEGVVGLCWGFAFPHFNVIKGTASDYMHCICEGVVNQLLKHWFDKEKKNDLSSIFLQLKNISTELISIKPPSELTRRPRRLEGKKDWKGGINQTYLFLSVRMCFAKHDSDRLLGHIAFFYTFQEL